MIRQTSQIDRFASWILPALAVAVPLAFSTWLLDTFELPKLFVLKVGVAVALLALALGASFDQSIFRLRSSLLMLLFIGACALSTILSVSPIMALFGVYRHDY